MTGIWRVSVTVAVVGVKVTVMVQVAAGARVVQLVVEDEVGGGGWWGRRSGGWRCWCW